MIIQHLVLFFLGFLLLWQGAGLILSYTSNILKKLKVSPFVFSFVFLGILTSVPEFSIGIQAILENKPSVFVGNLLGGIVVLFLLVIPLLAVFGKEITIKNELKNSTLIATLAVILLPSLLILDNRLTSLEGMILLVSYILLLYLLKRRHGVVDGTSVKVTEPKAYSYVNILGVILGVALTVVASYLLVQETLYFGSLLHIPSFYIGLLVIAVGTDLPELTLAIKSVISGKKEVAMGDYIGAAAVSTFMFGLFTLLNKGEVITETSFFITFSFIALALSIYYYLWFKHGVIKRSHGLAMLCLYGCFVTIEILRLNS